VSLCCYSVGSRFPCLRGCRSCVRFHGANFCYFFFCTITFVLGCAVTAISTAASVFVNDLNSDARKGTMCDQLFGIRGVVSQMYNVSQVRSPLFLSSLLRLVRLVDGALAVPH
jgi:fucose permease